VYFWSNGPSEQNYRLLSGARALKQMDFWSNGTFIRLLGFWNKSPSEQCGVPCIVSLTEFVTKNHFRVGKDVDESERMNQRKVAGCITKTMLLIPFTFHLYCADLTLLQVIV